MISMYPAWQYLESNLLCFFYYYFAFGKNLEMRIEWRMIKNKWIEKIYADYASTYFHLCQQHYPHFQTRYFCHECGTKIASFFHAMIWDIHIWRIKIYIFSFQLWETSVFPASVFSYFLSNPEDLFLLFSVADEKFINFLSHPNVYTIFYTLWKNVDIYLQLKILLLIFFCTVARSSFKLNQTGRIASGC